MGSFFTALITPSSTRGNGWDAFPTTETFRKCCSVDRGNIKPNHKPSDIVLFGQFPYVTAVCFIVWVLNMGHGRNKDGICRGKKNFKLKRKKEIFKLLPFLCLFWSMVKNN